MSRRMKMAGFTMTSDQWLALGKFLFGKYVDLTRYGCEEGYYIDDQAKIRFYCATCGRDFSSLITPTKCPYCHATADDQPQANTVTHKGHTAKVFPYFIPDQATEGET